MTVHKLETVRFHVSKQEFRVLCRFAKKPWTAVYVQSGRVTESERVGSLGYWVSALLICSGGERLLFMTSQEDILEDEISKIAVVSDETRLEQILENAWPRMSELTHAPPNLDIFSYLKTEKRLSLLRFRDRFATEDGQSKALATWDFALLVEHDGRTMAFYTDFTQAVGFLITTDKIVIDNLVKKSYKRIPCIYEGSPRSTGIIRKT